MIDYLGFNARYQPHRLAARELSSGRTWSYHDLDLRTARCAAALAKRGMARGERLVCLAKNRVDLVVLHLACARLGAIYVPLNWRWSPAEIKRAIEDTEPRMIIGDEQLDTAQINGTPFDVFEAEMEQCAAHAGREIELDLPSLILFTSGTSGHPKGVVLTERNLAESALNLSLMLRVTQESGFLCDAPMFHIIGLISSIRPALMQGGSIVISDGFVPKRTLERLADPALHITHYFCVPQMANALRMEPAFSPEKLRGLTALFTGGAPHAAASISRWLDDGILAADGYGSSEAGTVFGMPVDAGVIRRKAGSCGIAPPLVSARIVDESGELLGPDEAGELQLKGGNVFSGYWRRPDETRAAFTDDGWFRTGDIVRRDGEGFHWIVDRKKDMFISGGENVYPAEIEAALLELESVAECAVVGVADEHWGESGHLFVVVRPTFELDREQIVEHLERRIARYKIPKRVSNIESLPRNAGGKILKNVLRSLHEESVDE